MATHHFTQKEKKDFSGKWQRTILPKKEKKYFSGKWQRTILPKKEKRGVQP
ncbi:hypothetical protein [Neobacillus sp. FSL H8-0543]|uniref:hypothetical protein n=1 Tax=Neobacillus sp. FSL H8-0543 TaxID=2954672 RepID=UPI00315834DC